MLVGRDYDRGDSLMGLGADGEAESTVEIPPMIKLVVGLAAATVLYALAFKGVRAGGTWKPALMIVGGGAATALVLRGL